MYKNHFMKFAGVFLIAFCFIFSFTQCNSKSNTSHTDEMKKDSMSVEAVKKYADDVNKQCPVKVDEITRLDNCAVLPGKVFLYNYTISNEDEFELKKSGQNGINNIKNMIKSTPALAVLRQYEVIFRYLYKDKSGKVIYSFDINPEDYQ